MAHFTRRRPPPEVKGDYRSFRSSVREDFTRQCAYCLMSEVLAGGADNFELDHFRPKSKFSHLRNDFYNIYYSCHPCNHTKRDGWPPPELEALGIGLVDLCEDDFGTHFSSTRDGHWESITRSGQYTIDLLRLNRTHLVRLRRLLADMDLAPHEEELTAAKIAWRWQNT
jgi:hypothetical protein